MRKSAIRAMPPYFDKYILLVDDTELTDAFEKSTRQMDDINLSRLEAVGNRVYAPGKWTVRDIFQHAIDTERIFCYRALRFARNDQTPLHGFEQDLFVANAAAGNRTLAGLREEWLAVRRSAMLLFGGFDDEMLLRKGISSGTEISVLAIGFTIIGHQLHHLRLIEEKYVPLREGTGYNAKT